MIAIDRFVGYVVRPAPMPEEAVHDLLTAKLEEAMERKFGKLSNAVVSDLEIVRCEYFSPDYEAEAVRRLSTLDDGTFLDPGPGAQVWRLRATVEPTS